MEKVLIEANKREIVGKKVKYLRKEGKLPAVIYGSEIDTTSITLDSKEATNTLNRVTGSTILTINLDGKELAALVREIQRDYIRNEILHIDFQAVSLKEKLRTNVSITLVGVAPVLEEFNTIVVSGIDQVEVECLPQDLPETIEVDVSSLAVIGAAIYLKEITPPANVEILTDPEELLAVISEVKEEVIEEPEEELLLETDVLGEPEVIEQGKEDD
jgi:large subunit ribosomal protein L25